MKLYLGRLSGLSTNQMTIGLIPNSSSLHVTSHYYLASIYVPETGALLICIHLLFTMYMLPGMYLFSIACRSCDSSTWEQRACATRLFPRAQIAEYSLRVW